MTNLTLLALQRVTPIRPNRARPLRRIRPPRGPSAQLIADGVVAAYIHDISERHRPSESPHHRNSSELDRRADRVGPVARCPPLEGDDTQS
jgi:hypothetical protein